MPSEDVYGTLLNADTVSFENGTVVRIAGNGQVVRAQADALAHVQGLTGVNGSGTVGIGGPLNVVSAAVRQRVLLETGLTPAAGQTLYVSASVAGRATNVAPGIAVALGVIEDVGTYAADRRVLATINISALTSASAVQAAWSVANVRWYAVDGVLGDDANAGFSDVSQAAAGLVAKRTLAGLGDIFPRVGAGRKVVIAIRSGTYVGGLHAFLAGVSGYATNFPLVVGTDTNATASAVAFAGDANDRIYAGAVTVPGMNATGYNPVAPLSTTALKCLQVGGGAPGFPAEPNEPEGWRIRFDNATTTPALRNFCCPIIGLAASDTLTLPNTASNAGNLPATPALTDTFYVEKAGVNVDATLLNMPNQVGVSIVQIGWPQLVGINFTGASRFDGAPLKFCFSSAASLTQWSNQAEFAFSFVDETGTARVVGTGCRFLGSAIYNNPTGPNFTNSANCPFIAVGQVVVNVTHRWSMGDGSHFAGGVALFNTHADISNDAAVNQPTALLGGRIANNQSPCRITAAGVALSKTAGLVLAMAEITIGRLSITTQGANPAIALIGRSVISVSNALVGTTGNTDVGLDLTAARDSNIIITTTPTVSGTLGDVRLSDGTIVTWAQAAAGIIDAGGNVLSAAANSPMRWVAIATGGATVTLNNAPDGSPAAPMRYIRLPDGAGGFFTVASLT